MELKIQEVTLFEDRAQVLRAGTVELQSGLNTLRVPITPVASDRTLQVRCEGAKVLDAKVQRRHRVTQPELEDLADDLRQARAAVSRAELQITELRDQHESSELLASLLLTEVAEDADSGRTPVVGELRESLEGIRQRSQRTQEEFLTAMAELERLKFEALDRAKLLSSRSHLSPRKTTEAVIRLRCEAPGSVELRLEYIVPGACWRPWHRARLEGERLFFETEACIWQATGQAWDQVRLFLSTERASLGAEPPELGADRLRMLKVGKEVKVAVREQAKQDLGPGGTQAADELGGIDDGGEAVRLEAASMVNVPADGRPTRVPLFSFETSVRSQLRCAPELVQAVVRRTEQRNEAERPLLPGPVDLVRESGVIGRTWLAYTAPGADFELGWGPETGLRVTREAKEEQKEARMLSSWRRIERTVQLKLSNVGEGSHRVELTERVPVSEVEKIQIEVEKESADEDGFVRWEVQLEPGETAERKLHYSLKLHSDVTGF